MSFKKVDSRQNFAKMEEEVLKFWDENKIFEKSVENRKNSKPYIFYDGPPFATGTPHYGHIVASLMKDAVPRYWTMKNYYVERKWGWDCHGLPIENIAEKELGISRKKEIEKMGVEKFNEFCRSKVLGYAKEWEKVVRRLGRWADMKNSYKTMDLSFMESVWWIFKQLWDKGLIYEGYRSMLICPRCETTLSQSETAEGYKDIKDISVTVKFELVDEPGTFILAWTTTPWTLIGNVALAVGENIEYVKVECHSGLDPESKEILNPMPAGRQEVQDDNFLILAKSRIENVLKDKEYKIVQELKGKDLVGKKYKPAFDYYSKNKKLENRENGWKIYAGDFVTTDDGTGVVHIAPAFGEDDLNLGKKNNLPFVQHVGMDGIIKDEAGEFAGMNVKPADDVQKTDVEILKYLDKNNLLFAKDKYEHSYPHCWRCETPLINYATSSWFVSVEKIKDTMLETAKKISWTPRHIKKGRFGNWLEGARDWSISRQRYWASVMPIWKCTCGEIKIIGSVDEIKEQFGNPNKLFLIRHGQAKNNVERILMSHPEKGKCTLTEEGKKQIAELSKGLKNKNIDIIFSSPLERTMQTAEIISKKTGAKITVDERLKEVEVGIFEGKAWKEYLDLYPNSLNPGKTDKYGIEGLEDIRKRIESFADEVNEKYQNKNIVIVSHGGPLMVLNGILKNMTNEEILGSSMLRNGEITILYSKPIDLHKHIVDKIVFKCKECDGMMKRIPDVLDTWFDSGSMPYAQLHYPFENKEKFEKGFPAQFIAEGIDQTRCWFYYLHVIAAGIFKKQSFDNVIVNGTVLAEDGKKMSKRLNNYPDPMDMFNKYGADSVRFYLLSSPVMAAENLNFSEKEVAEFVRGMFRMLWNSYSFFVLYANIDEFKPGEKELKERKNLLDKWIISELQVLIEGINNSMENYELNRAVRAFPKFIDNLSNWYIRRSRKRFWKSEDDADKNEAYETLYYVLVELSKLLAPFCPFIAEEIYRNLNNCHSELVEESNSKERLDPSTPLRSAQDDNMCSVHLADFPVADKSLIDEKLNSEMEKARMVISEGLQLRAKAGIKVRQPLNKFSIFNFQFSDEIVEIIKDELNVKNVLMDCKKEDEIVLDTEITEDLKLEGQAREVIRFIQEMRKAAGYEVDNRIVVSYSGIPQVFKKYGEMIAKEVLANKISPENIDADLEKEFAVDKEAVKIQIKKD